MKATTRFLSREQAELVAQKDQFGSGRSKKVATRFPNFLQRQGDLLPILQMRTSSFSKN
jgi:hypothetical protein